MIRRILLILAVLAARPALAAAKAGDAIFDWVSYSGGETTPDARSTGRGQFRNPIIPGFAPDPSIVRVGSDFYIVNSSFGFFPGLPIMHSRDLIHWRQIGNAISRPGQMNFTGRGINRSIFAPSIHWQGGRFLLFATCIECGGNFVITAANAAGPWSQPKWLPQVDGIDPSLFVDADGRAWLLNNGAPEGIPQYEGHRAIWIQRYDLKTQQTFGPRSVLLNGGTDFAKKPIWIEGPHLFRKDGWYYLSAAEGGTSTGHSQVILRSHSVIGPYEADPDNPILTQRDLDPARTLPVEAAGHAAFVTLADGSWWATFLGTRPYQGKLTSLGRETFLLPVTWKNGWPTILSRGVSVPLTAPAPMLPPGGGTDWTHWRETFDSQRLADDWLMLRTPSTKWYELNTGALVLHPQTATIDGLGNPAFLARRQRHHFMSYSTQMRFAALRAGDRAGLVAFADETHHYFIGLWRNAGGTDIVVTKRSGKDSPPGGVIIAKTRWAGAPGAPIRLRIVARGGDYDFDYAEAGQRWRHLAQSADGRILATEYDGLLFTGVVIGPYAARSD